MGEQGEQDIPGMTGFHRVWTFRLLSGPPLQLSLPGTPPLDFQGKLTIWKLVGSKGLAAAAKDLMENFGVKVDVFSEEETQEQTDERLAVLAGIDPFPVILSEDE